MENMTSAFKSTEYSNQIMNNNLQVSEYYISSDDDIEQSESESLNENENINENENYSDIFESEYAIDWRGCYRSYSEACEKDRWNIRCGRCPDYALNWDYHFNQRHWPQGHDFINGYQDAPRRNEYTCEIDDSFDNLFEKLSEL